MLPRSGFSSSFNILVLSNIIMFTVCKGVDILRTTDISTIVSCITETEKRVCIVKWCVCDGVNAVPCCRTSVRSECQKLSCGQLNFEVVFEYF